MLDEVSREEGRKRFEEKLILQNQAPDSSSESPSSRRKRSPTRKVIGVVSFSFYLFLSLSFRLRPIITAKARGSPRRPICGHSSSRKLLLLPICTPSCPVRQILPRPSCPARQTRQRERIEEILGLYFEWFPKSRERKRQVLCFFWIFFQDYLM